MTTEARKAIEAAMTAPQTLAYTVFDHAEHTHKGTTYRCEWAQWVSNRQLAAAAHWPTAESLCRELADIEASYPNEDVAEASAAAWKAAKTGLPVEVGAALSDGRRTDATVESISWLFLDVDDCKDPSGVYDLHRLLDGVNHFVVESPTSRSEGKGLRVHCYIQTAPFILPSTAAVSRRDVKAWWQGFYAAVRSSLTVAVGLGFDTSVDDIAQPCFVSSIPPGCDKRHTYSTIDGQALDLSVLAKRIGYVTPRPGVAVAAAVPVATAPTTAQTTEAAAAPTAAAPSEGPTPGETTGSLIMAAMTYFGNVADAHGKRLCVDRSRNAWAVRCPWAANHKSDPRQAQGMLDSSTVIFDAAAGEDGGFSCKHDGDGSAGTCSRASAADVLSWARRKGAPLPDRASWGTAAPVAAEDEDDAPAAKPSKNRDARPVIVVRVDDVAGMRDVAVTALSRRADIYVQGGQLVDLTPAGPRQLPSDHLVAVLGETCRWVSRSRDSEGAIKDKATKVPREVVGAIQKAPTWPGIRQLRGVVKHPPLLASGRLVTEPGYDDESQLLYIPDGTFTVPAQPPTRDEALAAKDRLLSYVKHTNFCDGRGPAVWLSLVLTLAARTAMPTAPLFGFDAAEAKAGKTSLIKTAYGLIYGKKFELEPGIPKDDAEIEKRLPMWGAKGFVAFDNVDSTFGSPVLDAALTSPSFSVRRLGVNVGAQVSVDLSTTCWAISGNNITLGNDAASRCVIARINAPVDRYAFAFDVDDTAYFAAQRDRCVVDALTVLRGFITAGSPQPSKVPYCRFVEWSRLVRGAVIWLGMPDPVGGEVVDTTAEARATALRAICEWRRGLLSEEEQKALSREEAASLPFFSAHVDTAYKQAFREPDDVYQRRSMLIDALKACYGKSITGPAGVGYALQKLRDASVQLGDGRKLRFCIGKDGSKTEYHVEFVG